MCKYLCVMNENSVGQQNTKTQLFPNSSDSDLSRNSFCVLVSLVKLLVIRRHASCHIQAGVALCGEAEKSIMCMGQSILHIQWEEFASVSVNESFVIPTRHNSDYVRSVVHTQVQ